MQVSLHAVRKASGPGNLPQAGKAHGSLSDNVRPRRKRCAGQEGRRGTAVVEFAIVAPLLFLLILGVLELGRLVMVQQVLTNASREGARRGILEQATAAEVETVVVNYLTSSYVSGATVVVSPSSLSGVGFGDLVTVTISVPFDQVSWVPAPWFFSGKNLTAESMMHAERPE